jgi:hypothetical protein
MEEESMRFATYLRSLAAMLAGLIVLSACTVVVEDDGRRPGPRPPGPSFCTREYQPVCASRRGEQRTFANPCLADRADYRIIHRGECRREGGGREQRACTMEYRPVCATRRGNFRTFGNACQADADGWRIVRNRPC